MPNAKKLCTALGIADDHAEVNTGNISDGAYFAQKAMMRKIEARLKTRGKDYWLETLGSAGVPCGQVNYRRTSTMTPRRRLQE